MKISTSPLLRLSLIALAGFALASCGETEEDRTIASAQNCLDNAHSPTDGKACYDMVGSLTSEKAYLVKCSAAYISQGFTSKRMGDAFEKLKDSNGGNGMATTMSFMAFSKTAPAISITDAVSDCKKSGVRALLRLSTMSQLATTIGNFVGTLPDPTDPSFDPSTYQGMVDGWISGSTTAEQQTEIGNIAVGMNEAYCGPGSSFADNEICTKLGEALQLGGGNPQTIGAELLNRLKGN